MESKNSSCCLGLFIRWYVISSTSSKQPGRKAHMGSASPGYSSRIPARLLEVGRPQTAAHAISTPLHKRLIRTACLTRSPDPHQLRPAYQFYEMSERQRRPPTARPILNSL